MKNIAVIPARGGSKRIPRKNIKPFMGLPILVFSIKTALQTGLFDEVVVSTDDEEIAEIARQYGAKVPFMRSEKTSNDFAPLADVVLEVLSYYEHQGNRIENICCILATAPLLDSNDLIDAYNQLDSQGFDSVYPIVRYSYPIQRSVIIDKDGFVKMRWPEYAKTRSQDLEDTYHDSGTFYWVKSEKLKINGRMVASNTGGIVVDEMKVQDIDTLEDWHMAEIKYKLLYGSKKDLF